MATSDARPTFRLPWQSGHGSDSDADAAATAVVEPPAWPTHDLMRREPSSPTTPSNGSTNGTDAHALATPADAPEADALAAQEPGMTDTMTATSPNATPDVPASPWQAPAAPAQGVDPKTRKPTKFLADLTRAMRVAADEERQQTLAQFQAAVTQHVDAAHRESESAATNARNRAEEDITGLREWSKAEIARIKQETEDGIAKRRERLDGELADQTAGLELEIERVQGRVRSFETEMDGFFQRLAQEEDPARFAAMAEQLPEPPSFDDWRPEVTIAMTTPDVSTASPTPVDAVMSDAPAEMSDAPAEMAAATPSEADAAAGDAMTAQAETTEPSSAVDADPTMGAAPTTDSFDAAEAAAAVDWASAEAQAETGEETETPAAAESVADDWHSPADAGPTKSQVAVTGLVSVASIATFKRLLSRAPGITSVQVASGPDGEFVFSASHEPGCDVAAAVASLQGFGVEVIDAAPGRVSAKAVDPEVQ